MRGSLRREWEKLAVRSFIVQEAAQRLGRDTSSLSAAAKRLEQRMEQDPELERLVARLRGELKIT